MNEKIANPAAELSRIMCAKGKAGSYNWQKQEAAHMDPDEELNLCPKPEQPSSEKIDALCTTSPD